MSRLELTTCQERALAEILTARETCATHLLTGYAGTGKTTLMQRVARALRKQGAEVVFTAATHKAAAVLKARVGNLAPCRTIHNVLSLQPGTQDGGREVLQRADRPEPITADVIIIDECSMVGSELMRWVRELVPDRFVLFVGDPAQLPPVGEAISPSFAIRSASHLETVVRQAAGNPLVAAATTIRESQGGPLDWSWCRANHHGGAGLFLPRAPDTWMQRAFTSDEFRTDSDAFRYLCWTNARVEAVNRMVRRWVYGGETPTPFVAGERVIARAPVMDVEGRRVVVATNEEAEVIDIRPTILRHAFPATSKVAGWTTELPVHDVVLRTLTGEEVPVPILRPGADMAGVERRLRREAAEERARWQHRFVFRRGLGRLQAVYAMTVHTAQGSTFGRVFVDIGDITRRAATNVLETQQLLYVAATRPSTALILTGLPGHPPPGKG
ncbi:bacteriophage-type DNA helicase [Komagataeibacter diospyri]|uniref:ATP-dependent DNA helicase n=1 Tax=Komagataeibacter diospyri TaxID=1932662 RepID=UPI00113DE77A|nr:AAA family ATPase [Komagataeibacter diospyri]GCE88788.1 bacteriophage-type DNA helicase [Komagataeibacter diospyri]